MKILRKVAAVAATAALSMGLVAISATAADADTSWGGRPTPYSSSR